MNTSLKNKLLKEEISKVIYWGCGDKTIFHLNSMFEVNRLQLKAKDLKLSNIVGASYFKQEGSKLKRTYKFTNIDLHINTTDKKNITNIIRYIGQLRFELNETSNNKKK